MRLKTTGSVIPPYTHTHTTIRAEILSRVCLTCHVSVQDRGHGALQSGDCPGLQLQLRSWRRDWEIKHILHPAAEPENPPQSGQLDRHGALEPPQSHVKTSGQISFISVCLLSLVLTSPCVCVCVPDVNFIFLPKLLPFFFPLHQRR